MFAVSSLHPHPAAATEQSTPPPRLVQAAHEFEGQMMSELLKPLTRSDGLTGSDDDSGGGSNVALGEFASESLGKALSNQGGFGIARSIIAQLSHSGNRPASAAVTANQHLNTGMSRLK